MATEHVTVLDAGPSGVRIRAREAGHCGRCAMKSGCGHQLLSDTLGRQDREHAIVLPLAPPMLGRVCPGETLALVIDEPRLMALSLLHYGLPVACLLLATVLGRQLGGEGLVITFAIAAFGAGLTLVSRIARAMSLPVTLERPFPESRKSP